MGLSMELPIKVWVTYSGITKNNAMTWANKKKRQDETVNSTHWLERSCDFNQGPICPTQPLGQDPRK